MGKVKSDDSAKGTVESDIVKTPPGKFEESTNFFSSFKSKISPTSLKLSLKRSKAVPKHERTGSVSSRPSFKSDSPKSSPISVKRVRSPTSVESDSKKGKEDSDANSVTSDEDITMATASLGTHEKESLGKSSPVPVVKHAPPQKPVSEPSTKANDTKSSAAHTAASSHGSSQATGQPAGTNLTYATKDDLVKMEDRIVDRVTKAISAHFEHQLADQIKKSVDAAMVVINEKLEIVKNDLAQEQRKFNGFVENYNHTIATRIDEALNLKLTEKMTPHIHHAINVQVDQAVNAKLQGNLGPEIDRLIEAKMLPRDQLVKGAVAAVAENVSRFAKIEGQMEMDERAQRIDTLIIDGFTFTKGKSLKEIVIDNMWHHLGVQLFKSDLRHVARFGGDGDDGLPKSLKVMFVDVDLKNEILRSKGLLKNPQVVFREYLTEKQNDILNQAKLARKNNLLGSAWSQNGLIFANYEPFEHPTLLHNLQSLKVANDKAAGLDPGIEAMETENGPVTVDDISKDLLEFQRLNSRNPRRRQQQNANQRGQGRGRGGRGGHGRGGQGRGGQIRAPRWNSILSGRQKPLFPEQGARVVGMNENSDRPPIDERLSNMADPYLSGQRGYEDMGANQGTYGTMGGGMQGGYFGRGGSYADKARGPFHHPPLPNPPMQRGYPGQSQPFAGPYSPYADYNPYSPLY